MTESTSINKVAPEPKTSASSVSPAHRVPPHKTENWGGYTIDELRYQRAYTLARIEINNHRLKQRTTNLVDGGPRNSRNVVGKLLSAFSYVDLALLAWKVGSKVWQTSRIFKR
ncbi:MAG: hypothetical protein K2K55_02965 [Duncaniella sp.]|nr:hypothetical protein [Duncaniella sp.]